MLLRRARCDVLKAVKKAESIRTAWHWRWRH